MDHLWSPWRMKYINNNERSSACVFCAAPQQEDSPQNLIVARGQHTFVILNRFPYTSGHLMVVPYVHQATIEALTPEVRFELIEHISHAMQVIRAVYNPEGFNLGANIGAAAGAGIAEHVHFHIVPRWSGDANFMTTVGATRVLPEELSQTYHRILERWNAG
jgi:ATP adenylyltransferase